MLQHFKNPPNDFRPIPFWSWNDKLEKEELSYQIEEMKKAGVGGYFMHARSGLKVDYLSEEWFDCIETGLNKGKETGLNVWVYDEEGWPSGFAGGIVTALSPDYHAKFMTLESYKTTREIDKDVMIALYVYNKEDLSFKRIDFKKEYECVETEEILAVKRHVNPFYIDTMNKRAVEAFLTSTHEVYYEKYGEDFGTFMKGFFTDEPRLACNHFGELAWSDDLPGEFIKKYGYDIKDVIPSLYYKLENYELHRYHFWCLVNEMFVKSYMKTIYDWCEVHNCQLTGHIMMEESIFSQMTSTAGVMPFYEYMHVPGIDWLRRPISSPVIGKQVGSAACQLGKKKVLTESFALCGWNVSFEELKWIAEWQFVNGVNQICQHLEAYTIKGVRKRDYPPSLFLQQTWWEEYRQFNDYLGRLCVALSDGTQTADVLLIHPMRSGFLTYDGTRTDEIIKLDNEFTKACESLSGNHISYHLGDETIISNHASVNGDVFVVGEVSYKTVILPHMHGIDQVTLKLLLEFINNGGTVISVGRFPTFTDGNMENLKLLEEKSLHKQVSETREILRKANSVALSIQDKSGEINGISYQQRENQYGTLLFMVNHNQDQTYKANVTVIGQKVKVTRLIAETGEVEDVVYNQKNADTVFELHFEPMRSYLIQLEKDEDGTGLSKEANLSKETEKSYDSDDAQYIYPGNEWTIEDMDLNSMTLDYCSYRIDGGELEGPIPVIKLQNLLLELQRSCDVEMIFHFNIDFKLDQNKEFYTVIEDAAIYDIIVNQKAISSKPCGYWKDKSFHKVDIRAALVSGTNEIVLRTNFKQPQKVYEVLFGENVYETEKNKITYDIEIESIYLLGDFGVVSNSAFKEIDKNALVTEGDFTLVEQPKSFSHNEFTTGGLPFFAGQLKISQNMHMAKKPEERIVLNLQGQNAPLIKIYVNGKLVKNSIWAPYPVDITEYAVDGDNKIMMHIFASNRNLLGPHHHIDGECYNVGPESFTGKWSWVERKSEADATDISDRTKNYWTDTYSFVKFGI
ncbi:MAG: hypothetical protein K0S61_3941 [Anaerocolumna sp.]|nr:hypothetical protein [Anaerocolumna sp.]